MRACWPRHLKRTAIASNSNRRSTTTARRGISTFSPFARGFPKAGAPFFREQTTGVVEFKRTNQSWSIKAPHEPNKSGETKRYHILQLMAYCAAKGVNDGAIVTVAPSWDGKMRCDWYELDDWRDAVAGEQMRLSAAVGPVEPEGDASEEFRCRGCPVLACSRNPLYDKTAEQLERSLA